MFGMQSILYGYFLLLPVISRQFMDQTGIMCDCCMVSRLIEFNNNDCNYSVVYFKVFSPTFLCRLTWERLRLVTGVVFCLSWFYDSENNWEHEWSSPWICGFSSYMNLELIFSKFSSYMNIKLTFWLFFEQI